MVKLIIACTFLLFICNACSSQVSYTFMTFGDTASNDRGSASIIDDEFNAYFTGTISNGIDESDDIFFCKIDAEGDILWQYTFGGVKNEFVNNMILSSEGYFYICGDATDLVTGNVNGFLLKLNASGGEEWMKEYGFTETNEDFYGITELNSTDIAVVGFKTGAVGTGNDVLIVKYDTEGNVLQKIFYGEDINDYGMGIVEGVESHLYISGDRQVLGSGYNAFVAEFDVEGNLVWDHINGFDFNNGCKTIMKNAAGNLILVGESAIDISPVFNIMISEIDTAGNYLWTKWIGEAGVEAGYDIAEPLPGNYIVTGFAYNPETLNNDIIIVHTDQNGDELSRHYFGGDAVDYAYDIKADTAGNCWVSGFSNVQGDVQFALIHDEFVLNYLGATDFNVSNIFTVFPNPAFDHVAIRSSTVIKYYCILNSQGIILQENSVYGNLIDINFTSSPGIYFIRIITEEGDFVKKFIIAGE